MKTVDRRELTTEELQRSGVFLAAAPVKFTALMNFFGYHGSRGSSYVEEMGYTLVPDNTRLAQSMACWEADGYIVVHLKDAASITDPGDPRQRRRAGDAVSRPARVTGTLTVD